MRRLFALDIGGPLDPAALPPGTLVVYTASAIPLVFVNAEETSRADLAALPGCRSVVDADTFQQSTVEGIDACLVMGQKLALRAVNGFAERYLRLPGAVLIPGPPDRPPYPVIAPDGTLGWDLDSFYVMPQAVLAVLALSRREIDDGYELRTNEPLAVAIRAASQSMLVVVAAGNSGAPSGTDTTLSALARLPEVVSVGATSDEAGGVLADYSSRSVQGVAGPTLVGWGASRLDTSEPGTSFAAPRVAHEAMVLATWSFALAHAAAAVRGDHLPGVPLAGVAMVDRGPLVVGQLPLPANATQGVNLERLEAVLDAAASNGHSIDFTLTPPRLRALLIKAAQPVPDRGAHEVGHGFVSSDAVDRYIRSFDASALISVFGSGPNPAAGTLPGPLANLDQIEAAVAMWRTSHLAVYFDLDTRELTLT